MMSDDREWRRRLVRKLQIKQAGAVEGLLLLLVVVAAFPCFPCVGVGVGVQWVSGKELQLVLSCLVS